MGIVNLSMGQEFGDGGGGNHVACFSLIPFSFFTCSLSIHSSFSS